MEPSSRTGTLFGISAYFLWGVFPLYFRLLEHSNAVEIVGHRITWSLLVCLLLVMATSAHRELPDIFQDRRRIAVLAIAATAIAVNWGIYVYAVTSGQVVEASLGYFINPLVSVVLGVAVLHERLRFAQWAAVGVGSLAVVVLTAGYGHLPFIALSLALSFGFYGLLKKKIGTGVGALVGLTTETIVLSPIALAIIVTFAVIGRSTFLTNPPWTALLLALTGVATVTPLLLFAAAARRIPLSSIGLLQYLTPCMQLVCGLLFLGEHMPPERWIGFALVWLALVILSVDGLGQSRWGARREANRPTYLAPLPRQ